MELEAVWPVLLCTRTKVILSLRSSPLVSTEFVALCVCFFIRCSATFYVGVENTINSLSYCRPSVSFHSCIWVHFSLCGITDTHCCALCLGVWGIGVATQKVNLNQVPMGRDINSLVLRHDGSVYHNNEEKNRLPANSLPQEGDIVVRTRLISLDPGFRVRCPIFETYGQGSLFPRRLQWFI